jgi:hypothetical protein
VLIAAIAVPTATTAISTSGKPKRINRPRIRSPFVEALVPRIRADGRIGFWNPIGLRRGYT